MEEDKRQKAAETVIDAFNVVERIYRHAFQVLSVLINEIKNMRPFEFESSLQSDSSSVNDPKSWIIHYRGVYLSAKKFDLDDYRKKNIPILLLQSSFYNPKKNEPLLRYGVIEHITDLKSFKGARFENYFQEIIEKLHVEPKQGEVKTPHCNARVIFDEKKLLDIREDKDVVDVSEEIRKKYVNRFWPE
jgi:hypothetical protein